MAGQCGRSRPRESWSLFTDRLEVTDKIEEPLLPYTEEDLVVRMVQTFPEIAQKALERHCQSKFA